MPGRREPVAIQMPQFDRCRTAYQETGPTGFDHLGRGGVQAIVILGTAIPHLVADFHFVPDLEVAEFEVKAVRPTFVVVADNSQADFCPLVVVGRFMNVKLAGRMLDVLSQPVHHSRADCQDRLQVIVGGAEMVAARRVGVGAEVGKYGVDVDHVAGGPVGIVDAGRGDAERLMVRREVYHAALADRPAVDAVNRPDRADRPTDIHADFRRSANGRVRQRSQQENPGEKTR